MLSFFFNMEKALFSYVEKSLNYERLQLVSQMTTPWGKLSQAMG